MHDALVRVSVGDVRLYFDVEGASLVPNGPTMAERPTVVLLHGGPGADHTVYKPAFSRLASDAQVVYLDLRGHGRSDQGTPATWTWETWADDVAAFCDALDLAGPVLLGASGGGWVALQAAVRHPDRVGGLVLDSAMPAPLRETLAAFERLGGPVAREIARRYMSGEDGEELREAWERICRPLYSRRPEDPAETAERTRRVTWNHHVIQHFRDGGTARFDAWERLDVVRSPTLVLAGADDPVATPAQAGRLARALVNAPVRLEVLPGAGHGVFREVPEAAFAILRDFLARPPRAGP